jgi:NADH-quinone oxidoreductase subunit J
MTEVSLFILVGAIAIAAAAMMLLSENAVHSAMFLILTMGCIAFMFLLLDAAFLFLVQIAVYAGAIMVLFLFVIMLLGAEKIGVTPQTRFRWMTPVAMILSLAFLVVIAMALAQGQIDLQPTPANQPLLRVAHFAPDAGPVDVYVNGEPLAQNVGYGTATRFAALPEGEYNVALFAAGTQDALLAGAVTLTAGQTGTIIAYPSDAGTALTIIPDDLSTVPERSARMLVFNAYPDVPAVDLVDFGSALSTDPPRPLDTGIPLGGLAPERIIPETTNLSTWAFIESDRPSAVLFRLNTPPFEPERDTTKLIVLARRSADSAQAMALPLVSAAQPAFGSPAAVGQLLFTDYALPMQMVGVLLLVAMVGAIVLTHQPGERRLSRQERRRKVSRPLTSVISAQTGRDVMTPDTNGGSPAELPDTVEEPAAS